MPKRKAQRGRMPANQAAASPTVDYAALLDAIGQAHRTAQQQAVQAVDVALTLRNWLIGYHIFEYEQHGRDRAR
jgi:hypothetical protein